MNVGDDPDLALSIPLSSLMEEFVCPICFNVIGECTITPCGHNFCGGCIKECLNRKHVCPCCNAPAQISQLLKNHHHDRIVSIINREKEIASKAYFQRLMKDPKSSNSSPDNQDSKAKQLNGLESASSPVEALFHKHLKKSLHSFEAYYKDLEQNNAQMQQKLTHFYASKLTEAQNAYDSELRRNGNDSNTEAVTKLKSQIEFIKSEWQSRNQKLEQSFENSIQLLSEGYETYLTNIAPAPNFIPLAISVIVPGRDVQIKKLIVKANENSFDVKSKLEKKFEEIGNPLSKPFDPKKNYFIVRRGIKLENEAENKQDIIIADEFLPLAQYNVKQGDVFELQGDLTLKNDAPASCFTVTFKKDSGMKMDYFSCKDCKINWVCRPCAESCHKTHTLVDYIMDHPATWACCYCVKNKKCSLVKK